MGLNFSWQNDVLITIKNIQSQTEIYSDTPNIILKCNADFFIHLVPIQNQFEPADFVQLQIKFQQKGFFLVHLWEDIWLTKKYQVISRLKSFLGLNKSLYGRNAKITELTSTETKIFLDQNHLQGYIKAKYNYGLLANDEIIAAANFSEKRQMTLKSEHYYSAELVRFASKEGLTIVGGLSKLIKHFLKQVNINDLMTYADRDWSLGKGYDKLGFELTSITDPAFLYLNQKTLRRYFPHRLPKNILTSFENQDLLSLEDYLVKNQHIKIFNTGNLKYHLFL